MDSVVVTLRQAKQEIDLELPLSVPIFVLAPILIDKLHWSDMSTSGKEMFAGRIVNSGVVVRPNETLGQAGVVAGDILELTVTQRLATPESLPGHGRGSYLQSVTTGQIFPCRGRTMFIGRLPHQPINLTALPGSEAVSRNHANLIRRADGYWLKDEDSTNGTLVEGIMLKPKEQVRLRSGSQVQFGEDGPILIFYSDEIEAS